MYRAHLYWQSNFKNLRILRYCSISFVLQIINQAFMAISFTLGTRVPPNVDNSIHKFNLQTNPNPNVIFCNLFRSFCRKPKVYTRLFRKRCYNHALCSTILGLQPRDKAAMLVVNTKEIFLLNLHQNRVHFPAERNAFVLDHQHGRRDVTCKPAMFAGYAVAFPYVIRL